MPASPAVSEAIADWPILSRLRWASLSRRMWWRSAILLALALIAGLSLLLGLRAVAAADYVRRPFVAGPWGPGEGEFGQAEPVAEGRTVYGPPSFAVGVRGQVYVLDSFQDRVVVFDPKGKLSGIHPLGIARGSPGSVDEIAVDALGRLFLANREAFAVELLDLRTGRVERFLETGAGVFQPRAYRIESLHAVGSGGELYVFETILSSELFIRRVQRFERGRREGRVIACALVSPAGEVALESDWDLAIEPNSVCVGPDGAIYVEGKVRAGRERDREVAVLSPDGSLRRWVRLVVADEQGKYLHGCALVGVDGRGHLYLGVNLGYPGARVQKHDRHGRLVTRLGLPDRGVCYANRYVRVDRRGNVYVATSGPEGFQLWKYALRAGYGTGRRSSL